MRSDLGPVFKQQIPALRHVGAAIPGVPQPGKGLCGGWRKVFDIQGEERIELDPVRVLFLLIDMPKKRPPRPLRPHKRVLAAHRIEITTP